MEGRPGLWKRQFAGQVTRKQILFDIVFGVVGPALCFVFDPIVFRSDSMGPPLFDGYQALAYFFSGFEILALAIWLVLGPRLDFLTPFVAGILIGGSVFCTVLGLLLLPLSLLGLMLFVGVFGFTPFVTGLVYLRNGYRAMKANILAGQPPQLAALMLGLVLAFAGPLGLATALNQVVNISVDEILHGDQHEASIAAKRVRPLRFLGLGNFDRVVNEYSNTQDSSRKELLKRSYREATGEDIDIKLRILMD